MIVRVDYDNEWDLHVVCPFLLDLGPDHFAEANRNYKRHLASETIPTARYHDRTPGRDADRRRPRSALQEGDFFEWIF
jgi:hypothetical protein